MDMTHADRTAARLGIACMAPIAEWLCDELQLDQRLVPEIMAWLFRIDIVAGVATHVLPDGMTDAAGEVAAVALMGLVVHLTAPRSMPYERQRAICDQLCAHLNAAGQVRTDVQDATPPLALGCIRTAMGWLCATAADVAALQRMNGTAAPIYVRVVPQEERT